MLMHGPNALGMVALASLLLPTVVFADQPLPEDCTGNIHKESDVPAALRCKKIQLYGFTITSKQVLALELRPGATLIMLGDLNFDNYQGQSGPMMYIKGQDITFEGNNHKIFANGQKYWPKTTGKILGKVPAPVLSIFASGHVQNLNIVNSPVQAIGINNPGPLLVSNVNVDDSAGVGRAVNTDGMDIRAGAPLEVTGCTFTCQDDCIAISDGDRININHNTCHGGHGISIGSVRDNAKITNTIIAYNTLFDPVNGMRIKGMWGAKNAVVDTVTYTGNRVVNALRAGFIMQQNYSMTTQGLAATSGVRIENVQFASGNYISLASTAIGIVTVCSSSCPSNNMGLNNIKIEGVRQIETYGYVPTAMHTELSLIQRAVTQQAKPNLTWSSAHGQTGTQQTKPSGGAQSAGTKKSGQSGSHSSSHQHSASSASSHHHSASSASHQHRHHGRGHSGISGAHSHAAVKQHQSIKRQRKVNHHPHKHHHE